MKKKILSVLALAAVFVVALFAFVGCKDDTSGRDGRDFDLYSVYQQLVEAGEFTGTYSEFVKQYLNVEVDWDSESYFSTSINASLASVVSLEVGCEYRSSGLFGGSSVRLGSAGSGVVYQLDRDAGDAYIITNCHVIYDDFEQTYTDENGRTYTRTSEPLTYTAYLYGLESAEYGMPFTVIGYSVREDVAVLKIEDSDVLKSSLTQAVVVGDSDGVAVGNKVFLVGNALGEGMSVTSGIVSVESEEVDIYAADQTLVTLRAMRTDASANHGNSGGGLFSSDGKLLGILFAGNNEDGTQGVGNVLPINRVQGIADNILNAYEGTTVTSLRRVRLGISVSAGNIRQVYDDEKNKFGTEETVAIESVEATSPARGALQSGDVLHELSVGDYTVKIQRQWQISDFLWHVRAGDTVTFTVERNGERVTEQVVYGSTSFVAAA